MTKDDFLSDKEVRFVEEYLVDLDAAKAASRAGYSQRSAKQIGYKLLQRSRVQEALRARQRQLSAEVNITQRRVLNEYARLAFFRPSQLYDKDGNLIPIHKLPEDVAAAITGFKMKTVHMVGKEGTAPLVAVLSDVRWAEKRPVLRDLGEHLGSFDGMVKDPTNASQMTIAELDAAIKAEEEAIAVIERGQKAARPVKPAAKGTAKAK